MIFVVHLLLLDILLDDLPQDGTRKSGPSGWMSLDAGGIACCGRDWERPISSSELHNAEMLMILFGNCNKLL